MRILVGVLGITTLVVLGGVALGASGHRYYLGYPGGPWPSVTKWQGFYDDIDRRLTRLEAKCE
jgi:hypothetical protein